MNLERIILRTFSSTPSHDQLRSGLSNVFRRTRYYRRRDAFVNELPSLSVGDPQLLRANRDIWLRESEFEHSVVCARENLSSRGNNRKIQQPAVGNGKQIIS